MPEYTEDGKLIVDLDNPVWLSEPGYGHVASFSPPYCAIGKFASCVGLEGTNSSYSAVKDLGVPTASIWTTNDMGEGVPNNHWKAVRLLLDSLASGGKVFFKGTKVSDILKEKVVS